jgi:hypothetical protein
MEQISGRRKAGLVLGIVVALTNIPGAWIPPNGTTTSGEAVGPPLEVLVFGAVAGGLIALLLVAAWLRRSRALLRVASVLMVLVALTAVPAFFVTGVPAWVVAFAGAYVLATVVALVLLLAPERRESVPVGARA